MSWFLKKYFYNLEKHLHLAKFIAKMKMSKEKFILKIIVSKIPKENFMIKYFMLRFLNS